MATSYRSVAAHHLLRVWLDREGRKVGWLAQQLHTSRDAVSRWLHGRAVPRMVHRVQLENITDGFVQAAFWRDD